MSDELKAEAAAPVSNSFENPWPVAQLSENLVAYIRRLGTVWIEGELTKPSTKGTSFFAELRDLREEAMVAIHSFGSAAYTKDLNTGDRVAVLVKPDFWKKAGKISMQILDLRKVGLGELLERIQRLREKLDGNVQRLRV
jgi:exodeoxyribonuclease VII large subunit